MRFSNFRAEGRSQGKELAVPCVKVSAGDKYEMKIDEISPLRTIKPLNADQAMIAAKKRQVQVAKQALKAEKERQRRKRELEQQRKSWDRR